MSAELPPGLGSTSGSLQSSTDLPRRRKREKREKRPSEIGQEVQGNPRAQRVPEIPSRGLEASPLASQSDDLPEETRALLARLASGNLQGSQPQDPAKGGRGTPKIDATLPLSDILPRGTVSEALQASGIEDDLSLLPADGAAPTKQRSRAKRNQRRIEGLPALPPGMQLDNIAMEIKRARKPRARNGGRDAGEPVQRSNSQAPEQIPDHQTRQEPFDGAMQHNRMAAAAAPASALNGKKTREKPKLRSPKIALQTTSGEPPGPSQNGSRKVHESAEHNQDVRLAEPPGISKGKAQANISRNGAAQDSLLQDTQSASQGQSPLETSTDPWAPPGILQQHPWLMEDQSPSTREPSGRGATQPPSSSRKSSNRKSLPHWGETGRNAPSAPAYQSDQQGTSRQAEQDQEQSRPYGAQKRRQSRGADCDFPSWECEGEPQPHPKTGYRNFWKAEDLQQGLKTGKVLKCSFRVNPSDRTQGFGGIEGLPADIHIQGPENQNRAFPGDEVAVLVFPQKHWVSQRSSTINAAKRAMAGTSDQPKLEVLEQMLENMRLAPATNESEDTLGTAKSLVEAKVALTAKMQERPDLRAVGRVVAILEPSTRRNRVIGVLQREPRSSVTLIPVDLRLPKCHVKFEKLSIELRDAVQGLDEDPLAERILVSAMITGWDIHRLSPEVLIRESLGQAGELEVETKAILEMEGVDTSEFQEDVLACLPPTPWNISEDETSKRRDLRSLRLFSIDPPTARDLDDALSIEDLGEGRWRVGVHIADVSFFVPPGSALDAAAAQRATSVYMVQQVIHMLPRLLCEELCSLNPGVERLAFSVIWELDIEGHVLSQWTGRSVIRSCAKLAYHHAQTTINAAETGTPQEPEPPVAIDPPHTWSQVIGDVLALDRIARNLHRRRFENGALRLDKVKLGFSLDEDGNPDACRIQEQVYANELVAEFMLLANMSVAQLIGLAFPDKALLRRHPTPQDRQLGELEAVAHKLGYSIDCSSAGSIQQSLRILRQAGEDSVILDILQLQVVRPMKQARYFSTGSYSEMTDWRHYALAAPMYTHFTSPIRRYPDIVVHRLLAHLLDNIPEAAQRKFIQDPLGSRACNVQIDEEPESRQEAKMVALLQEIQDFGGNEEILAADGGVRADSKKEAQAAVDVGTKQDIHLAEGISIPANENAEAVRTPGPRDAASSEDEKGPPRNQSPPSCQAGASTLEEDTKAQSKDKPTRLLAEKVGDRRPKGWPRARDDGTRVDVPDIKSRVPVSTELLNSDELAKVAAHCNERKTSAKACSDASSLLYLCVMLRKQPRVETAVVTVVNGSRFFDVYIPSLGLEARIQVNEILPAADASWDPESRILMLRLRSGACPEDQKSIQPLSLSAIANPENLVNRTDLDPVYMPLEIKPFTKLPVVASARSSGLGKPLGTYAMLFSDTKPKQPQSDLSSKLEPLDEAPAKHGLLQTVIHMPNVKAEDAFATA